jgi:hypothetical protein
MTSIASGSAVMKHKLCTKPKHPKPQHTYTSLSSMTNILDGPTKARDIDDSKKHITNCIYLGILPKIIG